MERHTAAVFEVTSLAAQLYTCVYIHVIYIVCIYIWYQIIEKKLWITALINSSTGIMRKKSKDIRSCRCLVDNWYERTSTEGNGGKSDILEFYCILQRQTRLSLMPATSPLRWCGHPHKKQCVPYLRGSLAAFASSLVASSVIVALQMRSLEGSYRIELHGTRELRTHVLWFRLTCLS